MVPGLIRLVCGSARIARFTISSVITPQASRPASRHRRNLRNRRFAALLAIGGTVELAVLVAITVPGLVGVAGPPHVRPAPAVTVRVPVPGPTVTVTVHRPGPTVTVTELRPAPTVTVTCRHPGRHCGGGLSARRSCLNSGGRAVVD